MTDKKLTPKELGELPAYPCRTGKYACHIGNGMPIRLKIAAQIMAAWRCKPKEDEDPGITPSETVARFAMEDADALLEEYAEDA